MSQMREKTKHLSKFYMILVDFARIDCILDEIEDT